MDAEREQDFRDRATDRELLGKAHQRWSLFLAVANAGALVALGAKTLETLEKQASYLLLPSCWAFAVGLLLAGALPFLSMWQGLITEKAWNAKYFHGKPADLSLREMLNRVEVWFEILSAVAFCVGLFYPLVVVTIRYLETGKLA
jgi:hypothetical protein